MSSTASSEAELKGGHLPAVKVAGGVRITQHKTLHTEEPKTKEDLEEEKKLQKEEEAAAADHRVIVSGVVVKGDKDFPPQAVKAFHEKPLPAVQHQHAPIHHHVQQPRK